MTDVELVQAVQIHLNILTGDELRVVHRVSTGLVTGRSIYGPLDLSSDSRDWLDQLGQELRDALIYLMCYFLTRER